MAVLTENERVAIWRLLMSQAHCPGSITKTQFRAAVDAADDWLEANSTTSSGVGFNPALPQPYRGAASAGQKAALLAAVALKKHGGRDL